MLSMVLRLFGSTREAPANSEPIDVPTIRQPEVVQSVIEPTPIPQPGPREKGVVVPYYPRKGPAVPAAEPEKLIATQADLIREIRQACALSFDEFDRFMRPAIARYAAFVHLLPASECDHHSDLGGLFRHGLEVALNASRRAEGKEFALNEDPCVRKFQIFRWRACAMLGGMLHDLGKAVIDVGAIDESGDKVWNPHVTSLWEWIQEHDIEHYTIAWRTSRRHREHDAISATVLNRIVPPETMRWMGEYRGRTAYDAMLMHLTGSNDRNNPLAEIIKQADIDSVMSDRAAAHRRLAAFGSAGARGNAAMVVRAMRERITNGEWPVNEMGSPIWHTTDGLYAMYPQCAKEAIEHLRASGITSMPNEPPIVVDILREAGLITAILRPNGNSYNVHRIKVQAPDRNGETLLLDIMALKFANEHIIPDYYVLPPPVEVQLCEPDGTPRQHGTVTPFAELPNGQSLPTPPGTSAPVAAPAQALPAPSPSEVGQLEAEAEPPIPLDPIKDKPPRKSRNKPEKATTVAHRGNQTSARPDADAPPPVDFDDFSPGLHDDYADDNEPFPDDIDDTAVTETPLREWGREKDHRDAVIIEHEAIDRDPFPPTTAEGASNWIQQQESGVYLAHVIDRANAGELVWNREIFLREQHLHVAFPSAFEGCGVDPINLRDKFENEGWLERDPLRPQRPTVPIPVGKEQVSCVRFAHGISRALELLLPPAAARKAPEYGPYLTGERGLAFKAGANPAANGPVLRLAFYAYLQDLYRDQDDGWRRAPDQKLAGHARAFVKSHPVVVEAALRSALKSSDNPLVNPLPEVAYVPNPDYDHNKDEALLSAGLGDNRNR